MPRASFIRWTDLGFPLSLTPPYYPQITLYRNSTNIDRQDTLQDTGSKSGIASSMNPGRFFKRALKGVQRTAETTTTAFGNLATEIAGVSVLQPNSPAGMVSNSLNSANKSRMVSLFLREVLVVDGMWMV